jgi:hypothetical protein
VKNAGETTLQLLIQWLTKSWKEIQTWLSPNPSDSLFTKLLKGLGKLLVILLILLFSPVILLTLLIAFLIAF